VETFLIKLRSMLAVFSHKN